MDDGDVPVTTTNQTLDTTIALVLELDTTQLVQPLLALEELAVQLDTIAQEMDTTDVALATTTNHMAPEAHVPLLALDIMELPLEDMFTLDVPNAKEDTTALEMECDTLLQQDTMPLLDTLEPLVIVLVLLVTDVLGLASICAPMLDVLMLSVEILGNHQLLKHHASLAPSVQLEDNS